MDSALHTLEHCPAWAVRSHSLTVEIGWGLSPPAILEALLASERDRWAVISFCEQVMLRKQATERVRERDSYPETTGQQGRGSGRGRASVGGARTVAPSGGV